MRKYGSILLVGMLLMMGVFTGCSKSEEAPVTTNEKEQSKGEACGQVVFKGSSTLAPVITQLTKELSETNGTWNKVDEALGEETIDIVISGGGSGAGVKSMIDGSANFGMVSRPVSEEEKGKIEGYTEYKLGADALAISVNPENAVLKLERDLTKEDFQKVFSGEYKVWSDLDKSLPSEEIVLITRDVSGGAHKVFKKKVMGDIEVSENVIQAPSMGALVTKIIENKNAIGYASYGVINQNEGKIIPLKYEGVEATKENIKSGAYKISRPLLVIKNSHINEYEKNLIEYIMSKRGMNVVEELGFVPEN